MRTTSCAAEETTEGQRETSHEKDTLSARRRFPFVGGRGTHTVSLLLCVLTLFPLAAAKSTQFPTFSPTTVPVDPLQQKQVFSFSGKAHRVKLPDENGIRGVYLSLWGAGGGSCDKTSRVLGGSGAYVEGFLSLRRNDELIVSVGEGGVCGGERATFGGGGPAAGEVSLCEQSQRCGGSGGGSTTVVVAGDGRTVIAGGGGGGGAGAFSGGAAGALTAGRQGSGALVSTNCTAQGAGGGGSAERGGCGFGEGGSGVGGAALRVGGGGGGGGFFGGGAGNASLPGGGGSSLITALTDTDQSQDGPFPADHCAGLYALPSADQSCGASRQHGLAVLEIVYEPSAAPSVSPSAVPTVLPSAAPTVAPSAVPPSVAPSTASIAVRTAAPTAVPTATPSLRAAEVDQTASPTVVETQRPSPRAQDPPTRFPTASPSSASAVVHVEESAGYGSCSQRDTLVVALSSSVITLCLTLCVVYLCIPRIVACCSVEQREDRDRGIERVQYERLGYDDLDMRAFELPPRGRK